LPSSRSACAHLPRDRRAERLRRRRKRLIYQRKKPRRPFPGFGAYSPRETIRSSPGLSTAVPALPRAGGGLPPQGGIGGGALQHLGCGCRPTGLSGDERHFSSSVEKKRLLYISIVYNAARQPLFYKNSLSRTRHYDGPGREVPPPSPRPPGRPSTGRPRWRRITAWRTRRTFRPR
jgi:hypothetical protein